MPNGKGMLTPEEFDNQEDCDLKINIMYRLVYELYQRKQWDAVKDGAKTIFGGFLGGLAFLAGKDIFGK
jgi:hypothetical protein